MNVSDYVGQSGPAGSADTMKAVGQPVSLPSRKTKWASSICAKKPKESDGVKAKG
jgi:hypothetical protein